MRRTGPCATTCRTALEDTAPATIAVKSHRRKGLIDPGLSRASAGRSKARQEGQSHIATLPRAVQEPSCVSFRPRMLEFDGDLNDAEARADGVDGEARFDPEPRREGYARDDLAAERALSRKRARESFPRHRADPYARKAFDQAETARPSGRRSGDRHVCLP